MTVTATEWTAAEELFMGNVYQTTLNGSVGLLDTSVVVNDSPPSGFPQTFSFEVDGENFITTSVGGIGNKVWGVKRGQQSTIQAPHSNGAAVITVLSNGVGFVGGDEHVSIDLTGGRVLWVWGDPNWATASGQVRSAFGPQMHSVLAVQTGYDLSTASLVFYGQSASIYNSAPWLNGNPNSFFPDWADTSGCPNWVWPGCGLMIDGKLIILAQLNTGSNTSNFNNGQTAYLVDNPSDTPDLWNFWNIPIWSRSARLTNEPSLGFNSIVDGGDGYVYMWGSRAKDVSLFVARCLRTSVKAGNMSYLQWWCGPTLGWRYLQPDDFSVSRVPVFRAPFSARQGSQIKRPSDNKWMWINCDDTQHVQYSVGSTVPGAVFPALSNAFAIPNVGQDLNYMAQAHPEQTFTGQANNDMVVTYSPGVFTSSPALRPLVYLTKVWKVQGW